MVRAESGSAEPLQTFRWDGDEGPSYAVIVAVAEQLDDDPLTMDPLHDVLDPDALDTFFSPAHGSREETDGRIRFEYGGYTVVVEAGGQGYIYGQETDPGPA